jgi:hypothetical protein
MALVALRQGHGNIDLAGELLKTVFVAFFLADPDFLAPRSHDFVQAEEAIKTLIKEAASTDDWRLDEGKCKVIELILALHDQQLAALPKHRIERAKQRLMRVLEKGSFPLLTLTADNLRVSTGGPDNRLKCR